MSTLACLNVKDKFGSACFHIFILLSCFLQQRHAGHYIVTPDIVANGATMSRDVRHTRQQCFQKRDSALLVGVNMLSAGFTNQILF